VLLRQRTSCYAAADQAAAVAELTASANGLKDALEKVSEKKESPSVQPAAPAETDPDEIEEIGQDSYYDKIENADAPLVVVDFYTQWCAPAWSSSVQDAMASGRLRLER
jgi:hypothetical protein